MRGNLRVSVWQPARNHEHIPLIRPECFGRAGSNLNAVFVQAPIASSQEARPSKALRAFLFGTDRTGRVSNVPITVAAIEKNGVRVPGVSGWGPWARTPVKDNLCNGETDMTAKGFIARQVGTAGWTWAMPETKSAA
jgi:hypothetical protein